MSGNTLSLVSRYSEERKKFDCDYSPWYRLRGMASTAYNTYSVNIRDLLNPLSDERIIIPPYQRGYEWKAKQIEAFWSDIWRFHEQKDLSGASTSYFLGPIVVLKKNKAVTELLDGQQRIVTITVLFSVIRDIANTLNDSGRELAADTQKQMIVNEGKNRMLELSETDDDFFRDTIQSFPTIQSLGMKWTPLVGQEEREIKI